MQLMPPRDDLRPWFLTLNDLQPPLNWEKYFANSAPVEIDLGCGRGQWLVNAATDQPERNFLGIEIDYAVGRRTADRLKRRNLTNARVLGGDARQAFTKIIAPQSVAAVHVYFPDPWWKRKHRKRRVFTHEFVTEAVAILQPGGHLYSATDVPEYFEIIRGLMDHDTRFKTLNITVTHPGDQLSETPTNFERKAREQGVRVQRGHWQLLPSSMADSP